MKRPLPAFRFPHPAWIIALMVLLLPMAARAQKFDVKPVAEMTVSQLPPGPLYWHIASFPTLAEAKAAAGPAALAAEVEGRAWLFALGPKAGGGVAEIGPVPAFTAARYLLRINVARGSPGAHTPVHMHPGVETFYVLSGELTQRTPGGVASVSAGRSMLGHPPETPMQVSSSGAGNLVALVMFVADATKPFSSPTTMP